MDLLHPARSVPLQSVTELQNVWHGPARILVLFRTFSLKKGRMVHASFLFFLMSYFVKSSTVWMNRTFLFPFCRSRWKNLLPFSNIFLERGCRLPKVIA